MSGKQEALQSAVTMIIEEKTLYFNFCFFNAKLIMSLCTIFVLFFCFNEGFSRLVAFGAICDNPDL